MLSHRRYVSLQRAALTIQQRYRAIQLCFKQRLSYLQRRQAAITLQSVYRGQCARAAVKEMRAEIERRQEAATTIQRCYRGHLATRIAVLRYHYVRGAVIILQACWRGVLATRHVKRLRAATRIQAVYRGFKSRQEL